VVRHGELWAVILSSSTDLLNFENLVNLDITPSVFPLFLNKKFKKSTMKDKSIFSKSFWTALLVVSLTQWGWSQIIINVNLNPPYSPYVADYLALKGKAVATLVNTSASEYRIKLAGSIEGVQNGITGRTNPDYRPPQPIILRGGETKIIIADNDVFGIKRSDIITNLTEQQQNGMILSGILPEGDYRYCIQALEYQSGQLLSQPGAGCTIVSIRYPEAPLLVAPNCGGEVFQTEPQNTTFTWSPIVNKPTLSQLVYDLYLLKLPDGGQQDPQDLMNAAIKFNSGNPIKRTNILTSNYIFSAADATLLTGRYAWAVVVRDVIGRAVFQNNGISAVCTFTLRDKDGLDGEIIPPPALRPICNCNIPFPIDNTGKNSTVRSGTVVKVGNFDMTIATVTPIGKKLKGTGKINLPVVNSSFIPVRVDFDGMTVNAAGQMLEGKVTAIQRPNGAGLMPNADPLSPKLLPFSSQQAQNLGDYFKANATQTVSQATAVGRSIGLEMPLGIDKNSSPYTIALMDIRLTPFEAVFDAAVTIPLPDGNTTIALGAKDVCVSPTNLCGTALLYLSQDLNMSAIGLNLKGADPRDLARNPGTYVVFDRDGFKSFHIKAEYTFPAGTILRKDNDAQVAAVLEADCQKWTDWIASISMPEFYINGMKDFSFNMESGAFYDHSSLKNPENLPTITEKPNLSTPDWTGFFLPSLKVRMPEAFKSIDNKPITFSANNLIIDNNGKVSGSLNASNIITLDQGSLGGWYFSMDRIGLDFINNSITKGGLYGKVILPISGDKTNDVGSQLDYSCTLSNPAGNLAFQFAIQPKNDLKVPLFIAAANLKQSSSIIITVDGAGFNATADLAGDLSIDTRVKPIGKIDFKLIEFEQMWVSTQAPYFRMKVSALNSPQRYMSGEDKEGDAGGFPVGISDIAPIMNGLNVGIQFTIGFKLADISLAPSASTTLTFWSQINFAGGRPKWGFERVAVNKIMVEGKLGPVKVEGSVEFFDSDPKFGDGIGGRLKATFLGAGAIESKALFGKTGGFSYFYLDMNYSSFPPKIPLSVLPPISIGGFGGGVYYNLKQNPLGSNIDPNANPKDRYTPENGTMGILGTIILADNTGEMYSFKGTLNFTMTHKFEPLTATININGAIFPVDPTDPFQNAAIKVTGSIGYDFRQEVLDARLSTEISMGPLYSEKKDNIFQLHVDFINDKGYLKIGNPDQRLPLKLPGLPPIASAPELRAYLMIGNDGIPSVPVPPIDIVNALKERGYGDYSGSRTDAGGFTIVFGGAMGLAKTKFKFLFVKLEAAAEAGFDVSLKHYDTDCTGKKGKIGFEGWYATGQIWAYVHGGMSVFIDVFGLDEEFEVGSITAGALVRGGFPNPIYAKGIVFLTYRALGGRIRGGVDFNFGFGESGVSECNAQQTDVLRGIKIIGSIDPKLNEEKVDIGKNISVALNLPLEEPFNVETINANGKKKTEAYRIVIEKMELRNVTNGKDDFFASVDPSVADAEQKINAVRSNDNSVVTFYTKKAFESQSYYRLILVFKCVKDATDEDIPGTKSQSVDEHYSSAYIFKTGDCLETIERKIVYTNPLPMQRFFMKGEGNRGFIQLDKSGYCIAGNNPLTRTTTELVFYDGTDTQKSIAKLEGSFITFTIPSLKMNNFYKMSIIQTHKPISSNLTMSLDSTSDNLYTRLGGLQRANLTTSILQGQDNSTVVSSLWTTYFKTSSYNTFSEKMAAFGSNANAIKTGGTYIGNYVVGERFDEYDAVGYPRTIEQEVIHDPLVYIKESRSSQMGAASTPWMDYVGGIYNTMEGLRQIYLGRIDNTDKREIKYWKPFPLKDYILITNYLPRLSIGEIPLSVRGIDISYRKVWGQLGQ
jgi:hypothetical protein